MVAEFEEALKARGASFYKRLHWEAGLIGQLLYLEAENARQVWDVHLGGRGCCMMPGLRGGALSTSKFLTLGDA